MCGYSVLWNHGFTFFSDNRQWLHQKHWNLANLIGTGVVSSKRRMMQPPAVSAVSPRKLGTCQTVLGVRPDAPFFGSLPWRSRLVEAVKSKRASPCGPGVYSINRRSKEEKVSGDSQLLVTYSIL